MYVHVRTYNVPLNVDVDSLIARSVLEAILVISATTLLVFTCAAAFSTCISHDHDVIVVSVFPSRHMLF